MNDLQNKLKDPREALKLLGIETPEAQDIQIPFAPGMQPVLPDNYNQLAQEEAVSQEENVSMDDLESPMGQSMLSQPAPAAPQVPRSKEEDILSQYKKMIADRENKISDARGIDSSNNLNDTILKSMNQIGSGIANRSGRIKVDGLNPISLKTEKEKQALGDTGRNMEDLLTQFKMKQQQEASTLAKQRAASDDAYKQQMLQLQRDRLTSAEKIAASKIKGKGITKGQEKLDQEYAKEYNDYTSKGRSNAINAIAKLKEVTSQLKSESGFGGAGGGAIASLLPDAARADKSIKMRDAAITSANSALKELFGAQLSDSEREAAAKEFYNDRLSNEDNIETINRKIKELQSTLKNKDEKAKEFMNKGTLSTFQPQTDLPMPDESPAKSSTPAVGSIINAKGKRYRVIDKDGNLEEVK